MYKKKGGKGGSNLAVILLRGRLPAARYRRLPAGSSMLTAFPSTHIIVAFRFGTPQFFPNSLTASANAAVCTSISFSVVSGHISAML